MSLWGRVFAASYDRMMSGAERAGLSDMRQNVVERATGRVLEIGAGTGLNLAHYRPDAELLLSEPEEPMAKRLRRRIAAEGGRAQVIQASGDRLPLEDDSVDSVVATLVLCTVPDAGAALGEIGRVLRPGGRLYFLEHVRSEDPRVARWQDRIHPVWIRFGHGCHCNRDTMALLRGSGLAVEDLQHGELPNAPPWIRPAVWGSAVAS